MALLTEPLYKFIRPGFPKETWDESSFRTVIEYVTTTAAISASGVNVGSAWGRYPGVVTSAVFDPIEGTEHGVLVVSVDRKYESADYPGSGEGAKDETNYELDWVDVQRSLFEHPVFRVGGGGAAVLTNEDVAAIKKWEVMPDPEYKKDYMYVQGKLSDWSGGSDGTGTLTDNAKLLAKGMEMGIEFWIDKAPVARKSETYIGGPPPKGEAGQKEEPSGFPNLPTGYEWIREADRSIKTGGQTRWQRNIEWKGAKKVLIDVDQIFWT